MIDTNEEPSASALFLSGEGSPVDAEFKPVDVTRVFVRHGLGFGRCFGSKSAYREANPGCEFIPNANVFTRKGKVWWGDLDLARDKPALEEVGRELRCRLYVLREMDGRFEKAGSGAASAIREAVWCSGGPAAVRGVRQFLARSGLTTGAAGFLMKVNPRHLRERLPPTTALEIERRMTRLERSFRAAAKREGFKKWGAWWTSRRTALGGRSPLQVVKSGGEIDFGTLTNASWEIFCYVTSFPSWRKI